MEKLIVTVAGVGAETTETVQPALPMTAAEIGVDAARCEEAGAAIYHLHVRDAAGNPTQAREAFAAAVSEIRARSDIIIQASTGGAMGMSADERLQPLELEPEMASLTTGTSNFGDDVFFNDTALMSEVLHAHAEEAACAPSSRSSRPVRSTTRYALFGSTARRVPSRTGTSSSVFRGA